MRVNEFEQNILKSVIASVTDSANQIAQFCHTIETGDNLKEHLVTG